MEGLRALARIPDGLQRTLGAQLLYGRRGQQTGFALNFLLGLCTSVLMTLSFPRFNLPWLMPAALTPLLLASVREKRWSRRLLIGWLAGAGTLFGVTDWIRFVLSVP